MAQDVFSTFDEQVETRHAEMLADLESISVDNLKTEGITITMAGKSFRFKDVEVVSEDSIEDMIKKEFKSKLNAQQTKIRDKINAKINQLVLMHQQKQDEFDRKERQLKDKFKNTAMMPSIKREHYLKGLSVVKGLNHGELLWIYRGWYNPRYMVIYADGNAYTGSKKTRKAIPERYISRLKKPMLLEIKTKGDRIIEIDTKEADGSNEVMMHYHQRGQGDCWGSWRAYNNAKWDTPDDILKWAREAEGVLETINQGSIAKRSPAGMPRFQTILDAVEKNNKKVAEVKAENTDDDDVWNSL